MTAERRLLTTSKTDPEDIPRQHALISNTALEISTYLSEIENKREVYQRRWIWELLQNAFDAAPKERKIEVKVSVSGRKLQFEHDGRPFDPDEVAHLIYHGSTKSDFEIGKFGTGFLVTHLISREVEVSGARSDGKIFSFLLDRRGKDQGTILENIERSWERYKKSLKANDGTPLATASYAYTYDEASSKSVSEGISALREIAPLVLVFNRRIGQISITEEGVTSRFSLKDEKDSSIPIIRTIEERTDNLPPTLHEIWMNVGEEIEIALDLSNSGAKLSLQNQRKTPKIFIGFPLFATDDLPYPVVVNSRAFKPTEKRDGIFLGKTDTDYIKTNKKLMREANFAFGKMISNVDISRLSETHPLLTLGLPPKNDWLTDEEWFKGLLADLIKDSMKIALVPNEDNALVSPNECYFPFIEESKSSYLPQLWDLAYSFADYKGVIPTKSSSLEWMRVIRNWESLGLDLSQKKLTVETIAKKVETSNGLEGLKKSLVAGKDPLAFLNEFYKLMRLTNSLALVDERRLIPNQNGIFVLKKNVLKDEIQDEALKNISSKLGKDERAELANNDVSLEVLNLLTKKEKDKFLSELIILVRTKKSTSNDYLEGNRIFLKWLIDKSAIDNLPGFPLHSLKKGHFILLKEDKDRPLSPCELWPESARSYVDLFPEESVISSEYFGTINQVQSWRLLSDSNLVRLSPIFSEPETLPQIDLDELAVGEGTLGERDDHESSQPVTVSKIAFLDKDSEMLGSSRSSREKARRILSFVLNSVLQVDNMWSSEEEIDCRCGHKHKVRPALWLSSLKRKQWVPVRRGKSEKPSVKTLLVLFDEEPLLLSKCREEGPNKFLDMLGVSFGELMINLVAKDNDQTRLELSSAMGSLYSTFSTDPKKLTKVALLAEKDVGVFVEELEHRLEIKQQVQDNQTAGRLVEALLRSTLENEKSLGIKLVATETGVGSDFAVHLEKSEKRIVVEVKSTVQDHAKMTLVQAKEARDQADNHTLAVFKRTTDSPTESDIKNTARFVTNIGSLVGAKVSEAEAFEANQFVTATPGDIQVEITESPIGIRIYEKVWNGGKSYDEFLDYVKASLGI